jgi:peptide/nickel transport system ATP-binding protein
MRVVNGVSLVIHAGENVGLVGESGSGKSTLLRSLLALEPPQTGEVLLLGEGFSTAKGRDLRRLRRSIQAVFQDPYGSFDPQWPVERLIAEPFHLLDAPPSAKNNRRARTSGPVRRRRPTLSARILRRTAATHRHRASPDHRTGRDRVR